MKIERRHILKGSIVGIALTGAGLLLGMDTFVTPKALPEGMLPEAPQRCLALFLICVSLWFTNMVHPAAVGLLAIAMLPLLGIIAPDRAFALFGNSAVFFMLGVFLMAAASISTGLSKRITLLALQRFDKRPALLVSGVAVSSAFLALWMPEHAVAAMIYPIIVETVESLRLKKEHPYAQKLFFALAWGAIIGGVGTFLGGARAPLALSLLRQSYPEQNISFGFWMAAAMPVVILMVLAAVMMLRFRIPDDIEDIKPATAMLDTRVRKLGPMSGPELRLALLAAGVILCWITLGHSYDLAVISIIGATLLFMLRIVTWKQVQGYVNWGVLVMYGGAVALGKALTDTHAMQWLAHEVINPTVPAILIIVLLVAASNILTEGISNAAAVAVLLPIGFSLGDIAGIDPIVVTMTVTIPAGLAFLLPISSPPNAISYSAGHYGQRMMFHMGWPMSLTAFVVVVAVILLWWPVLGLKVW